MRTSRGVWRAVVIAAIFGAQGLGLARAQPLAPAGATETPAPALGNPADVSSSPSSSEALSVRYRLVEKYSLTPIATSPEVLSQYQVATRETVKTMHDLPQGTPERTETVYQIIYTERPAKISGPTGVTDTVRRYDAFRTKSSREIQRPKLPYLEKLGIWYRAVQGQPPQLFSLTPGRQIREWEYDAISSQVFLPQLSLLFPSLPKRVGDTWRIPRNAARALIGETPQADEYDLTGRFDEVRKGNPSKAILSISGQVLLDLGPTAVNARLTFSFDPKAGAQDAATPTAKAATGATAKAATGTAPKDANVVEARGSIDEVGMALALTRPLPEGEGRLKETITREVLIARRLSPANVEPLAVPTTEPDPGPASSWLTYDDPMGRFHFRHPQELHLPPGGPVGPDEITLFDQRPSGLDVFVINLQPPVKDTAKDRKQLDPDEHRRQLEQQWQRQKQDVLKGPREWLPDAEWAPLNRKVYRIEAALRPISEPNAKRIYLDYYLVLFERNQSIVVTAMTMQDPHVDFRKQSEEIIKTFKFGASDGTPPPALSAVPAAPPATTDRDAGEEDTPATTPQPRTTTPRRPPPRTRPAPPARPSAPSPGRGTGRAPSGTP